MSQFEAQNALRVEMSHNLRGSLQRAITYAYEQSHRHVTLEHLLLALTEDREAIGILEASTVDVQALVMDVSDYLGRLDDRVAAGTPAEPMLGNDVQHIIHSAGAAAQKSRRSAVGSALVLAAIVGDGRSPAAELLRNRGLTFEHAVEALRRANNATPPAAAETQPAPLAAAPLAAAEPHRPAASTTPTNSPAAEPRLQNMQAAHEIIAGARERIAAARGVAATRLKKGDAPESLEVADAEPAKARPAAKQAHPDAQSGRPDSSPAPGSPVTRSSDVAEPSAPPVQPKLIPEPSMAPRRQPEQPPATKVERPIAPPSHPRTGPPPVHSAAVQSQPSVRDGELPPGHSPQPSHTAPPNTQQRNGAPPALQSGPGPFVPTGASPSAAQSVAGRPGHPQGSQPPQTAPPAMPPSGPGAKPQTRPRAEPQDKRPIDPSYPPDRSSGAASHGPRSPDQLPNLRQQTLPPERQARLPYPDGPPYPAPPEYRHGAPVQRPPPPREPPYATPGRAATMTYANGPSAHVKPIEPEKLIEAIPTRMRVGVPTTVEVRVPRARLEAWSGGNHDPQSAAGQVITKAMVMRLKAPDGGFTIEPASPETQWSEGGLGPLTDEDVSWRWVVTPSARGRQPLQLHASARVVGRDGLAAARSLPEQTVEIRVASNYARVAGRLAIGLTIAAAGIALGYFGEGLFSMGGSMLALVMR